VYEYTAGRDEAFVPPAAEGDEWRIADAASIQRVFGEDPRRGSRFHRYVAAQHTGLLLMRGEQWISYGWCRKPGGPNPPHLPRRISGLDAYWIFGCHTREPYRCRGIYKQLLARLIALACHNHQPVRICIDTHEGNIASRRAILASGFRPCGTFSTYRMWIPALRTQIVGGRWRREEVHPSFPYDVVSVGAAAMAGEISYKTPAV
jgi:GNAT superfamily N-acetyltransferase